MGGVGLVLGAWLLYHVMVVAPRSELPERLKAAYQSVVETTQNDEAAQRAEQLCLTARTALNNGQEKTAEAALESLRELHSTLQQAYTLQIVSSPGEQSGVWRVPEANPDAHNYYIILQAVTADGRTLQAPVVNEETGRPESVSKWGLRVEEDVFRRIAADKLDDGIIQQREFGVKHSGKLKPDYRIPTTGAAITQW